MLELDPNRGLSLYLALLRGQPSLSEVWKVRLFPLYIYTQISPVLALCDPDQLPWETYLSWFPASAARYLVDLCN